MTTFDIDKRAREIGRTVKPYAEYTDKARRQLEAQIAAAMREVADACAVIADEIASRQIARGLKRDAIIADDIARTICRRFALDKNEEGDD